MKPVHAFGRAVPPQERVERPIKVRSYHHASNVSGAKRFLHGKFCSVLSLRQSLTVPDSAGTHTLSCV
jgi:hypothetical protein